MGTALLILSGIVCLALGIGLFVWGLMASIWPHSPAFPGRIGVGSLLVFGALGIWLLVLA